MDIFAHALWTNAIYKSAQRRTRSLLEIIEIVFWSDFPDFFSFGIVMVLNFFKYGYIWRSREYYEAHIPQWLYTLHHILYSLPIFFVIFLGIWGIRKKIYWPMAGWFIHIVIDIFSHKSFFPPHFLWPFFPNVHLEVISWGNRIFMAVNYSALTLVYGYWYFVMRKKGYLKKELLI